MSDSVVRQHTRLTATNPIDPRLVALDFTETMSAAIGAIRMDREHTPQQILLNFGWLVQGPLKLSPRGQAAADPKRISDGGRPVHGWASYAVPRQLDSPGKARSNRPAHLRSHGRDFDSGKKWCVDPFLARLELPSIRRISFVDA